MANYFYDGVQISDTEARSIMARTFGVQHARKYTMYESIERMAAKGNARATEFLTRLIYK